MNRLRKGVEAVHIDDPRRSVVMVCWLGWLLTFSLRYCRVALTNKVAHKIELNVFGLCRSKERYILAAIEQEQAICLVFSEADDERAVAVWDDTECDDENVQNARDIVRHLLQLCSRAA